MITPLRPDAATIERYRAERQQMEPSFTTAGEQPQGFHRAEVSVDLGVGPAVLELARDAIAHWRIQTDCGVLVTPADEPVQVGATVAILTRQLGLWILAACRVTDVVDTDTSFGFTYATMPDHPECGEESFVARTSPDETVRFEISATWRAEAALARLGAPVSSIVQRRATRRYLDALVRACTPAATG